MLTWEERIEVIKDACDVKNNRQLEETLGLSNGYINDLLKGKNKNPSKITAALIKVLKVSPAWFYDETIGIFGESANKKQRIDLTIQDNLRFLDVFDEHILHIIKRHGLLSSLEDRLAQLEKRLDRSEAPDGSGFTSDPEPEYGEPEAALERIPYMEDIAAGPPIPQFEAGGLFARVPPRHIRGDKRDYYAARIRGESMSGAGIPDGSVVLVRRTDAPRDGAIQVVAWQGRSTLKRLREKEGGGWEMRFEDGTDRAISVESGECQVQGDFVAVLPPDCRIG